MIIVAGYESSSVLVCLHLRNMHVVHIEGIFNTFIVEPSSHLRNAQQPYAFNTLPRHSS